MATVVTYLLVSDPEDPATVRSHPVIQEHDFELRSVEEGDSDALRSMEFAAVRTLEASSNLEGPSRTLSSDVPEATITCCRIEERFDQVEHVRSVVFIGGQKAGEIEHGYVLNIGT